MMNQSVVVVSGPLQPFRRGFEDRLVELGYRPSSVLRRLVVVAQFSRWLATEGVEPDELSACGMDAFVAQVASTSRYRRRTARRALRDLLGYLVEWAWCAPVKRRCWTIRTRCCCASSPTTWCMSGEWPGIPPRSATTSASLDSSWPRPSGPTAPGWRVSPPAM